MGMFDNLFKKPTPPAAPKPVITPPPAPIVKTSSRMIQPATLKVSDSCRMMVGKFEGCKLKAYQDIVGVWTIGYGQTRGVKAEMVWTQEQADSDLLATLSEFANGVKALVKVPLDQNQFDALVSLAYNIGLGNLKGSTLLRELNFGHYQAAHDEFVKWNRAGGQVVKGLTHRRLAEAAVFASESENLKELEKVVLDIMMAP